MPNISREEAVNLILASIAMEELGLSNILNAEGEKLQYVLGTIEGTAGLTEPPTIENILEVNKSVRQTLNNATRLQMMLDNKMESAAAISAISGKAGPPGPVGVILGSYNSLQELEEAHKTGSQGDAYLVGGDLYVWNVADGEWEWVGNLQGPAGPEGPIGPRGFDGANGEQGPQGPMGVQGIQGEAGIVGTIRGSYDTEEDLRNDHPDGGEAGEFYYINPDLWVWDDVNSDWLNVGQIAGPQGIQGVQGVQGIQGIQGVQGERGEQGEQGEPGPVGPPGAPVESYNFNLSGAGSSEQVTVGNVIFTLSNLSSTTVSLSIRPASLPLRIDFARSSYYYLAIGVEAEYHDNYMLSAPLAVDATIYSQSNEQQKSWLRQQNPDGTWSLCEYSIFASANGARVTLWINWIYKDL